MTTSGAETPAVRLPIVFRPHIAGTVGWFAIWLILGGALFVLFRVLGAPPWVQAFMGLLVGGGCVFLAVAAFSYVRFTEDGFEARIFRRHTCRWADVEAWTQWGENGSTYVRTASKRVINLSDHACGGKRGRMLRRILTLYAGPETRGSDAVCPALIRALFGSFLAAGPPEPKEPSDEKDCMRPVKHRE
ncbi:MAG TPA: hypothetical protein VFJ30_06470 [Phycisphaerae bacterium]|nr:hypothetical protein [Phycisphaerae bacterium]